MWVSGPKPNMPEQTCFDVNCTSLGTLVLGLKTNVGCVFALQACDLYQFHSYRLRGQKVAIAKNAERLIWKIAFISLKEISTALQRFLKRNMGNVKMT